MAQPKEFAGLRYREGAIDPKTMQLLALAAMAAAGCTSLVPGRFAAAKQAGATDDEISETLMYAMRGAARATWSTIKYIPGVEDLNKEWKTKFERETSGR